MPYISTAFCSTFPPAVICVRCEQNPCKSSNTAGQPTPAASRLSSTFSSGSSRGEETCQALCVAKKGPRNRPLLYAFTLVGSRISRRYRSRAQSRLGGRMGEFLSSFSASMKTITPHSSPLVFSKGYFSFSNHLGGASEATYQAFSELPVRESLVPAPRNHSLEQFQSAGAAPIV